MGKSSPSFGKFWACEWWAIPANSLRIKAIPFNNERVPFLSKQDRDRLIEAYSPHIRPIITLLAFHGPRIQTALQLPWGMDGVDMQEGSIRLNHSKNAVIRSVPMHPRVMDMLRPIWEKRGAADKGACFPQPVRGTLSGHAQSENSRRQPDQEPARQRLQARGDRGFHRSDWRHHWAPHCVMAGIDLITIMNMGGWESLRMFQHYSSVSIDHMREAINKFS